MRHKLQGNLVIDAKTGKIKLTLRPCRVYPGRLCTLCKPKVEKQTP
jgi:hypothetical protein